MMVKVMASMFLELEKLAPKVVPLPDNIIDSLAGLAIKTCVEEQPVDFGRHDLFRSDPSKTVATYLR